MKFTASPAEEAKPATDDDAATETQEESPAAQVWRRYKALAAGTPEPEESEKDSKIEEKTSAIKKPEEVKAVAVKEEEKQPVGFEAVIQEYRRAKEQRKTLHSLSVSRPEPPAAPKSPDSSKTP